jgi:DNA-directed RNA polymerase sigma subunit (sigma70/sigma32)
VKPSEEQRLGKAIIAALEQVRLCVCRTPAAAQWHLDKAANVIRKPKLLERAAPHLEGKLAEDYLASLPAWLEEAKLQESHCATLLAEKQTEDDARRYDAEREQLVTLLLRFDFSLRSYERLARQPAQPQPELVAQAHSGSNGSGHPVAEACLAKEADAELQQQIEAELRALDLARAELVTAHDVLIMKYAQDSSLPVEEAALYARRGLTKAAENFDVRRGVRFSTYARWWIKTAIKEKKTWAE